MTRSLWLFNVLLALVVLVLAAAVVDSLWNWRSAVVEPRPSASSESKPAAQAPESGASPALGQPALPPLSDFEIVVQKDVFKNPLADAAPPTAAVRKPPPAPLPNLLGTVFIGEERKAILSDGRTAETYTIGQPVAGGTLVKIEADKVVIEREGTSFEVPLKAAIQPVRPPGRPGAPAPALPGPPAVTPSSPPAQTPSGSPGPPGSGAAEGPGSAEAEGAAAPAPAEPTPSSAQPQQQGRESFQLRRGRFGRQ